MATLAEVRAAREQLGLSVGDLWITYFAVGGNRDVTHLAAYLANEGHEIDPADHDCVIAALNETFIDRGLDHPLHYGTT
jgi:hypothetical protein